MKITDLVREYEVSTNNRIKVEVFLETKTTYKLTIFFSILKKTPPISPYCPLLPTDVESEIKLRIHKFIK